MTTRAWWDIVNTTIEAAGVTRWTSGEVGGTTVLAVPLSGD